jgi:ribosomal protein L20
MASLYKDSAMETLITRTIRAAMVQEGMTYADLAKVLKKNGINQSESTLRSKVNNGTMATSLFLHIMSSTNSAAIDLPSLMDKYEQIKS